MQLLSPADLLRSTATSYGSSRMSVRQRCSLEYDLTYRRGLQAPAKAVEDDSEDHFEIGSLVHAGQHAVNQAVMAGMQAAPDTWQVVMLTAREQREAGQGPLPWDRADPIDEAERLLDAYYAHYGYANGGWPESFMLAAAETLYGSPELGATTRADLELERHGQPWFVDTKTKKKDLVAESASEATVSAKLADAARNYGVREQFLRTAWLIMQARQLPEPPHCMVDLIIKTKVPKFRRIEAPISKRAVELWHANLCLLQEADEALAALPATMNYDACVNPITDQRCRFFGFCHGTPEERAAYKEREASK